MTPEQGTPWEVRDTVPAQIHYAEEQPEPGSASMEEAMVELRMQGLVSDLEAFESSRCGNKSGRWR